MFVNTDCGCSSQIPKAAAILLPSQAEVWSSIYWNHFGAHSQWREISKGQSLKKDLKSRVFWLMIDACGYLQNYLQKKIETDRNFLVEFRCHASFPLPGWCPSWRFCGFFFESPGRKQQQKRWTLGWHSMVPGWLKGILTMFWYTVIRTSLGIIPDIIQPTRVLMRSLYLVVTIAPWEEFPTPWFSWSFSSASPCQVGCLVAGDIPSDGQLRYGKNSATLVFSLTNLWLDHLVTSFLRSLLAVSCAKSLDKAI